MTSLSLELRLFSTPWHWFVHGLGLGQRWTGFHRERAARIRALARAVVRRYGGGFQAFVAELVEVILTSAEPADRDGGDREVCARLGERIAGLGDPRERARACAVAVESLVKLDRLPPRDQPYEHGLRGQLARSLKQVAALRAPGDRARYGDLHLLANLVLAAGQAGWADLLRPSYLDAGARLLGAIDELFYHVRGAAIWQSVVAIIDRRARGDAREALRQLLDRLDVQLERPCERPCDGVHEDRDYLAFPLFLTLGAVGAVGCLELLDYKRRWLEVAAAVLESLSPRARASQELFFVALLRNVGTEASQVGDPPALVRATAERYLAATDGRQLDDYLRCTYLVHLARQLGCSAALPARIDQILAESRAQLGTAGPFRATPYGSPLMWVAYVLSALHAGDWNGEHHLRTSALTAIIDSGRARSDDAVTLPRLGLALIDAALCLGRPSGRDTALFTAFAQ